MHEREDEGMRLCTTTAVDSALAPFRMCEVGFCVLSSVHVCSPPPFQQHLDLERFGVQLNLDGVEIAKLAGVDQPRLFMTEDMCVGCSTPTTPRILVHGA